LIVGKRSVNNMKTHVSNPYSFHSTQSRMEESPGHPSQFQRIELDVTESLVSFPCHYFPI
jgi:hypothetical protein